MSLAFRPHDRIRARTDLIGAERAPVLVIDDFTADPQALVDHAAALAPFPPAQQTFYPGLRAPVPPDFVQAVHDYMTPALQAVFGLAGQSVVSGGWEFSLVTTPPQALTLRQRLPHINSTHPGNLALLLYLSPEDQGGTSFYRHRSTGFETIDEDRFEAYEAALAAEAATHPPTGYIRGDTPVFERIHDVEPVFNRLVAYRSRSLHAASLAPGFRGSADPTVGRLTLNLFFHFRPQATGPRSSR